MKYPPKHIAVDWMNTIWETSLPSNAKLVAANLRRYMNAKNDMAWPSIAKVAGECGLCERSVQGALKLLCSDGWLVHSGQSKLKTNIYQASFPEAIPHPRITCTPQEMHPAGDAPLPRRRCTLTPAGDAPELNKVIKQVNKQVSRRDSGRASGGSPEIGTGPKNGTGKKSSPKQKTNLASEKYGPLADRMWERIQPMTKQKKFNRNAWANDLRKLIELDGHAEADVWDSFLWANQDHFWAANILSPAKLREKMPTINAQRSREKPKSEAPAWR